MNVLTPSILSSKKYTKKIENKNKYFKELSLDLTNSAKDLVKKFNSL